jgi:hypothetical protein
MRKELQDFLNDNIENIESFEINFFDVIIRHKDSTSTQICRDDDDEGIYGLRYDKNGKYQGMF